MEPAEISYNSP